MPAVTEPSTKSGIITSETGERHIPSSLRPDGSQRKEIKIRPGYKPPEDVEVYKNRTAESWKSRGSNGIPGAATIDTVPGDSKTSNKNAKRREARKKAKASEEAESREEEAQGSSSKEAGRALAVDNWRTSADHGKLDVEAENEKQARNLKKKLRQARDLRDKKDKGENLLPEQFEKVIKISELIRELDSLGFDPEGQPKEPTV
ncbi:MAG: hypothetical protein LQ347_001693 [Umbilicaria vellea]|nr:MAG: hypothetical protein LQ347_001693 [Umbilicaria vellea]